MLLWGLSQLLMMLLVPLMAIWAYTGYGINNWPLRMPAELGRELPGMEMNLLLVRWFRTGYASAGSMA